MGKGLICCVHQIQAARIYLFLNLSSFFCLQLGKIKSLLLQNYFNMHLMATAGGMWALLTLCYISSKISTEPRILKCSTNVGYNLLYCVRKNQPPPAYHSLYLSIYLSLQVSVIDFSASMRARVFKFLIHLDSGQVYCGKENQDAEIHFCLPFPFFFFHLSLQCNT